MALLTRFHNVQTSLGITQDMLCLCTLLTAHNLLPTCCPLEMRYMPAPVTQLSESMRVCMCVCRLLSQPGSPRSKKFKGPSGLPIASPVMDPGHLLTKLNADITQKHRHEFSLETCLGPTIFHRTKVGCTCLPACLPACVCSRLLSFYAQLQRCTNDACLACRKCLQTASMLVFH